ncbi:MAG TPA: hypothetical protein VNH64_00095 [Parvularculaceae bacterium]|nr:hypothetical protein [Parvularculaceae bacterium]
MFAGRPAKSAVKPVLATIVAVGLAVSAPAYAGSGRHHYQDLHISIDLGNDKNLLPRLIEMDADDIADMRREFADACADIDDAIEDIADAKEEAKSAPGGAFIMKIAFAAAREATDSSIREALDEVSDALDRAERDLKTADVSDDERVETQLAIDTARDGIASLRPKLDELVEALRA